MDTTLQQIANFAGKAHGKQRRKFADEPYINHPVRVMEICREYTNDICVLSAALLHDVLEDTETTKEEIRNFLRTVMDDESINRTIKLVEELTDIYTKKRYPQLNRRQRKSKEAERLSKTSAQAQTIKYADIIDNSQDIVNAEPDFTRLFLYECRTFVNVMNAGNPDLRRRAGQLIHTLLKDQKQIQDKPKS